jgi:hypothetical protein
LEQVIAPGGLEVRIDVGICLAALPPDVRKVSDLPIATELILGLRPIFEKNKFQISRDSQALYITMVAKDRLPVFQTDAIKKVTCEALNEARGSGG